MVTKPTLDQLKLPKTLRSRFLITRFPDGQIQGISWATAEHVRGRRYRVKRCFSVWVSAFNDYAERDEWAKQDCYGNPIPVSTTEAIEQLRAFEPESARTLQPYQQISDVYELTDTLTAELQHGLNQLPDNLQKTCGVMHYETALGRQRFGFNTIGELTCIDEYDRPEPGQTMTLGTLNHIRVVTDRKAIKFAAITNSIEKRSMRSSTTVLNRRNFGIIGAFALALSAIYGQTTRHTTKPFVSQSTPDKYYSTIGQASREETNSVKPQTIKFEYPNCHRWESDVETVSYRYTDTGDCVKLVPYSDKSKQMQLSKLTR